MATRMAVDSITRVQHEIEHGRRLASGDTEFLWGWETPAGRMRVEHRSSLIVEGANLKPGMVALEIGCGTGLFTSIFSRTGAKITALELVPELIEKAQRRSIPGATFITGRFEDCPGDSCFDAVIGNSVLHHLEVELSLRRIYQLLKPGARMSFAEPNMMNPQIALERKFHYLPIFDYVSPDETAFVRWRLRALLEEIGYADIRIKLFDWLHPHTPPRLVPAVKRISNVLERVPIIREISGCLAISAARPA
jgi:2-polyprenyl-3-methyl-5-hydroxy-6-metoxy-1,4-benzoquinol methylase